MLRFVSLSWQLTLIPLVFALGLGFVVAQVHGGIDAQRARAAVIDLAGRQRTLTNVVVREALTRQQGGEADPESVLELMRSTAETLSLGGKLQNTAGQEITVPSAEGDALRLLESQLTKIERFSEALERFTQADAAQRDVAMAELSDTADDVFESCQGTVTALVAASNGALDELGGNATLAGAAALLLGVALAVVVAVPIRRQVGALVSTVERVAEGDLGAVATTSAKDEHAQLEQALARTVDQLREVLGSEQVDWSSYGSERAARMEQLVAMVDSSPIATMRFDSDMTVAYRNEAAREFFLHRQVELQEGSPTSVFAEAEAMLVPNLRSANETATSVQLQCHGETLKGEVFRIGSNAVLAFSVVTDEVEQRRQIEEAVVKSTEFATELAQVAERLAMAVQDTAEISSRVAVDSNEVSEGTASVAAAAEEMNATVTELSTTAQDVAARVEESAAAAQRSADLMELLQSAGNEIGRVTDAISSIADQTNLLALNASIEAAGAGDAGRGFAVVASEVKDLARETMDSTASIAEQIESIRQRSSDAVLAVGEIGSALGGLRELAQNLANGVEEQSATTSEISRSISDAAMRAGQIRGEISGLESSAEESSQTSQKVRSVADELEALSQRLTQAVSSH